MTTDYSDRVEDIRLKEYPHMNSGIYLDHGGTTIYARSLVDAFAMKMTTSLYGNPHSANKPAQLSGDMVDDIREKTLRFLGADPRHFDLVFVANATAAIKLVGECFRDLAEKTRTRTFWYGYHKDAHTSLVGLRELTNGDSYCFESDTEVQSWLDRPDMATANVRRVQPSGLGLFAYPGQSNLSGRRLPLSWVKHLRDSMSLQNTYSLLDAAALAVTRSMTDVFRDVDAAPDFTCLSFYKIFGFPDLGGLVVRKDSGHILTLRKYFGGGTVLMVSALAGVWHKSKSPTSVLSPLGLETDSHLEGYNIHDSLEDGTLPFHSIIALGEALFVHSRLYGSMESISRHTTRLGKRLFQEMKSLRHGNGRPVCYIYSEDESAFGDANRQGATLAFNIMRQAGTFVPYSDVERMANEKNIYIRSGGVCNPGGLYTALRYEPWELARALSAGLACGSDRLNLIHHLPTGIVRVSLGAMSTEADINAFISFLQDSFAEGRDRSTPLYIETKGDQLREPRLDGAVGMVAALSFA
ncbi:PLP-dependent transferase [Pleurostoma richardsiae]|uniref:PLP-dependent transferase n=1 Tax=Pleurostoma richardsiae TaxID=41990 RepID=A0AA38VXB8_9PEZI|nr:PLP-dependent transferase [Pleurostoma richardsiae]